MPDISARICPWSEPTTQGENACVVRRALLPLCLLIASSATAAASTPSLAVLDIELTGDLGGPELATEHQGRIERESSLMRAELAATNRYRIVDDRAADDLLKHLKSEYLYLHDCNGCDLQIGQALGAQQVLIPWITRVSALILTLTYEIHDTASGQILARASYDFRGDNDAAWTHAIRFMVRHLQNESGEVPRSPGP